MSQTLTLARPYARAAYDLARQGNSTADWSNALALSARIAADPNVAQLLGNPLLSRQEAAGLVAPEGVSETIRSFFATLADNGRLNVLPEIAGLFEQYRADAEHIVRAKVTSASPMSADELANIKAALKRRFNQDVEIDTAIDESLIGGAVIDAGDVVIDGSLKGKLARLQNALAQ
ncbi:F0F1 ATP synthase subunit delta [Lysobacter soyae]|jgi:F-type H+-transporting ATPase subunit delta|uniref:ATP synthase subunit delta n=1 Tax=Lysobacter soyae TaxID=2764185 RepID=A0ABX8WMQ3_9GAMM|nr:F0F1 ATP synthase subunit delta [Lysobacter sp. CJ11]QYR52906.1 F0F1 ATP synthase subunit delta [Lysobacter sp. CJ11]